MMFLATFGGIFRGPRDQSRKCKKTAAKKTASHNDFFPRNKAAYQRIEVYATDESVSTEKNIDLLS